MPLSVQRAASTCVFTVRAARRHSVPTSAIKGEGGPARAPQPGHYAAHVRSRHSWVCQPKRGRGKQFGREGLAVTRSRPPRISPPESLNAAAHGAGTPRTQANGAPCSNQGERCRRGGAQGRAAGCASRRTGRSEHCLPLLFCTNAPHCIAKGCEQFSPARAPPRPALPSSAWLALRRPCFRPAGRLRRLRWGWAAAGRAGSGDVPLCHCAIDSEFGHSDPARSWPRGNGVPRAAGVPH